LTVAGTGGLTFSGVGGEITFTNGETIDNDTDGTITLTAPTTALSGDLAINGGNITTALTADSTLTVTGTLTANGTLDANGAFTLGDNGDTGAIDTTTWDIDTSGNFNTSGTITAATDETINGVDISSGAISDVTDLALVLGAGNDLTIDAATTDNTGTTGIINIDLDSTASQQAVNLDIETITDAAIDTLIGLDVLATQTSTDNDVVYGIRVQNLAGTPDAGNEYAIYQAGTSWDYGLYIEDDALFNTAVSVNGNTTLGDTNADTLTINAGSSGTGIAFGDSSFANCTALETVSGVLTCGTDDTGGGSSAWSSLTDPAANLTLAMAAYNTTFNWDPGADSAETNFSLTTQGEDTTGTGDQDQVLLALSQTANGVDVDQAADALLTFANADADDPVVNAIRFDAGGAGTDFTYGINFDAASFGTAELLLSNGETIANTTDGTITLTAPTTNLSGNLDVDGSSSDIAGTLNLSGNTLASSGDLVIDPTGGGVKIGTGTPGTVDLAGDDLYVTGDLEVAGTIYGSISGSAGSLAWDDLTDPDAALSLAMAEYPTTFNWNTAASSAAFDGFTYSLTNDATTDGGNQRVVVINNADDAIATGTTENLLVLNNADANEAVTTALSLN
ncbi:MAG: autotransporter-associated beta strand repeat protein, nonfunctional, partial [Parcubacteria group bacterium GW2011_GWB1_49_7]